MDENPIIIMACDNLRRFNKILFPLWVPFNIKTVALHWLLLSSCSNSSVLERAAAPLYCHHWISLIQRLSVCALQIMMISCLDQSSFFKFWLTFTWSLLRKKNIFQSMSEHGRPESSQEVGMPKNRDYWRVEIYQAEARWRPLVDGFGKCIKLWSRMSEYEDDLKFSKKIVFF